MLGPPPAIVPLEKPFTADLCGSDPENYVYLRAVNPSNLASHEKLRDLLQQLNSSRLKQPIPEKEIAPGMFVIIEGQGDKEYYRAKVISNDNLGTIHCFLIDDGICLTVLALHVFPMLEKEMESPAIAMKCRLEGMKLFKGLPHLKMAFKCIKMAELEEDPYYEATALDIKNGVVLVRMEVNGQRLTDVVQQWISTLCAKTITKISSPIQAEIVHADEWGWIWFHIDGRNEILVRIEETLQKIDPVRHHSNLTFKDDGDSWKKPYVTVPTAIYIVKSQSDRQYYRAKMTRALKNDKFEIEFIDYGNREVVHRKSLILAVNVDENLAYIPRQCIKAKLNGIYRMDVDKFWSYVPKIVDVLVIEQLYSRDSPEVEIFQFGATTPINNLLKSAAHVVLQGEPVFSVDLEQVAETVNEPGTERLPDLMKDEVTDVRRSQDIDINQELKLSEKMEFVEEELKDSGVDTLNSDELKDLEGGEESNIDITMDYEHLLLQSQAKLSKIIDKFCKDVQTELEEIQNLEF